MKMSVNLHTPIIVSLFLAIALLTVTAATPLAQPGTDETDALEKVLLERVQKKATGDLPKIRKSRFLRVLVTPSKTNFFIDMGTKRGFEYELLNEYEKFLNKGVKKGNRIKLIYIPLPFDDLLAALREGRGDIVAAGLTITPEREKRVDFTDPYIPDVSEVVVLHKKVTNINTVNDLAGRTVCVRAGSSYITHLNALNKKLTRGERKAVIVKEVDHILTTEDILEMVNAGVIPISVADHHIAEIWASVFSDMVVRQDLVINSGGRIAWPFGKTTPNSNQA